MKQSKKLLSLVLAIILMFGTVSVVANAALVKSDVTYDVIDNAALTPEEVADLALDMVDADVMPSLNKKEPLEVDLLVTEISIRTDTIDHLLYDLYDLYSGTTWALAKGVLGDVGDLDLSMLKNVQRSGGDLNVIYALLKLLNDNASIISKVAYGIGTGKNQLSFGTIVTGLIDLGETGDILSDLPKYLTQYAYDELVHGSYSASYADNDYSYPSLKTLKKQQGKEDEVFATLPTDVDTLDEQVDQIIYALLTQPQDYEWKKTEDTDEDGNIISEKVWDMNSVVFPSLKSVEKSTLTAAVSPSTKSVFQILDYIAPYAINDLGIVALNNNLKKQLMEAVGVDFNEIDVSEVPSDVKAVFDAESNYVTYISYDCLEKSSDGAWYYTTLKTTEVKDPETGEAKVVDGKKVTEKTRKYYKANAVSANEFYDVINWDWKFVADSNPGNINETQNITCIDYEYLIQEYKSIFGSLNHLLYVVFENALTAEVKADFKAETEGKGWVDGDNSNLNANILRIAKYILLHYTSRVFGKSSEYVTDAAKKAEFENTVKGATGLIELVEYIGLPMFGDAMPQLILDADDLKGLKNNEKLYAFGAAILREFMTQIAAERNYDSFIYEDITSKDGRKFLEDKGTDYWFNLILNMGMDIAFEYTNKALVDFEATDWPKESAEETRWKGMLNQLIDWAVDYIGDSSSSVLAGLEGSEIAKYDNPLDKISYALNKILPLGFISGCSGTIGTGDNAKTVAFSLQACLDNVIRPLAENLDIAAVISLFGRNTKDYNILNTAVITMVVDLVNDILALVFGKEVLPASTTLNGLLTQANLKTIVKDLLTSLYSRREALLLNALPVVAEFIPEWGGEQEIDTPEISLENTISLTNGAATGLSFTISNGSTGVWRRYKDVSGAAHQDNQYAYKCIGLDVKYFTNDGKELDAVNGDTQYVSGINIPGATLDFGQSETITFNVSNITENGLVARFDVKYFAYDEDGKSLTGDNNLVVSKWVYISYNPTNEATEIKVLSSAASDMDAYVIMPYYVAYENGVNKIPSLNIFKLYSKDTRSGSFFPITGEQKGISVKPFTADGTATDDKDNAIKTKKDGAKVNGETVDTGKNVFGKNFAVNEETYKAQTFTPGEPLVWNVKVKLYKKNALYKDKTNSEYSVGIIFYSGDALANVSDLVKSETKKNRNASDYETGDVFATKILTYDDSTKDGKKVLRESNFKENNGTGTKINGTEAWQNYVEAFNEAVRLAYQPWNANSVYNHQVAYENLKVAAADLDWCKIDTSKVSSAAASEKDAYVDALKTAMKQAESSLGGKSFYDYKMYRWSRYEDARKDARNLVAAFTNQNYPIAETQYFTYRSDYKVTDLNKMVAGNKYEKYIKALYEDYTADEIEANTTALTKAKDNYANISTLDYVNAANLVTRTADRLLERDTYANVNRSKTQHLKNEYDSAVAVIGTTNKAGYTAKSWDRYEAALTTAKAILDKNSDLCDEIFDAKYELQVARNELRTEEADDSELKALIAQAQNVLATVIDNPKAYANTEKEIGEVLAALGMADVKDLDGNDVDLFPNGALNVVEKSYDVDETKKYDRAANALREALSKLRFAGTTIDKVVKTVVGTEKDDNNNVTDICAETLTIAQRLTAAQAAALVKVSGGTSVVSVNGTYALDRDDKAAFTGTGSTLTVMDSNNKPLYTVNLVVKGDVNGDGVVDVLDTAMVDRAVNEHVELTGLYLAAAKGGTQSDLKAPTAADYSAVVNEALAG